MNEEDEINKSFFDEYLKNKKNRVTIYSSFGISSKQGKNISKELNINYQNGKKISKNTNILIKKAFSIASSININNAINNLKEFSKNIDVEEMFKKTNKINIEQNQELIQDFLFFLSQEPILEKIQNIDNLSTTSSLDQLYRIYSSYKGESPKYRDYIYEEIKTYDEILTVEKDSNKASNIFNYIIVILITIANQLPTDRVKDISSDIIISLFSAIAFEYSIKPNTDNLMKENELNQKNTIQFIQKQRITTQKTLLFSSYNSNSKPIENLDKNTLLTIIQDKNTPSDWLKVKITLEDIHTEGYVLRVHTSSLK